MLRLRPAYIYLILFIVAACLLAVHAAPIFAIALGDLSRGERLDLSGHFQLMLAAERTREYREDLDGRIATLEEEIGQLSGRIEAAEDAYVQARSKTGVALRWIQRRGPISYLEVLLGASSLRDALRRMELARSAARGALIALDEIRADKMALDDLRDRLEDLEADALALKNEREQLAVVEADVAESSSRLEQNFGDRWESILVELDELVQLWIDDTEEYLTQLPIRFTSLARRDIEPENVTVEASLFSVRASVPEESLTAILRGEPGLESTRFQFSPDGAELIDDERRILIQGELQIDHLGIVSYSVSDAFFGDLPITDAAVLESIDGLELDLGPALGGMRPQRLEMGEGEIVLILSFFSR